MLKRLKLERQFAGFDPTRNELIVAQRWSGFPDRRAGFVVSTNDRVTKELAGTTGQVNRLVDGVASSLRLQYVDDERARDHLLRINGTRERHCRCTAVLPIGGRWCVDCGQSYTHDAPHAVATRA